MASSPKERVWIVYNAYMSAYDRRIDDWKNAETKSQSLAIDKNLARLELAYLKAARKELSASGVKVEEALKAAKAATKQVNNAYKSAKKISEKIKSVTDLVRKIESLVKQAV